MVKRLSTNEPDYLDQLEAHLTFKVETDPIINETVHDIIEDVITRGDAALVEYTNKFDQTDYSSADLKVSPKAIEKALDSVDTNLILILKTAAERIRSYHEKQLPEDHCYTDDTGTRLGWQWRPVDRAGLYVPGGMATYPSSVLMNAIPAKVAGVNELVMVVPTPKGQLHPLILAAAHVAGVDTIYKIGGAQAIAALAYGTRVIPKVNVIVGPGNAYVAAAKKQVYGMVGIDMIAGPSEILIISDGTVSPDWLAADLLSQAEHDANARAIFITLNASHADAVVQAVEETLSQLARESIARKSWKNRGLVVVTNDLQEAIDLSNHIAPEHLELCVEDADSLAQEVRHAGAIFIGRYTPEAVGDYMAGPSHVLPTAGNAAFASGLDVFAFLKRSSIIQCSDASIRHLGQQTTLFAEEEGLGAHALSMQKRLDALDNR